MIHQVKLHILGNLIKIYAEKPNLPSKVTDPGTP